MTDVKVYFNGEDGASIDLTRRVEGKHLYSQKALINVGTEQGTDPLYEERGTTLMTEAIGGYAATDNGALHMGNFAALDTLSFLEENEYESALDDTDRIRDMDLHTIEYDEETEILSYGATFFFRDGTQTTSIETLPVTA